MNILLSFLSGTIFVILYNRLFGGTVHPIYSGLIAVSGTLFFNYITPVD